MCGVELWFLLLGACGLEVGRGKEKNKRKFEDTSNNSLKSQIKMCASIWGFALNFISI
jgi:hypothetical protein